MTVQNTYNGVCVCTLWSVIWVCVCTVISYKESSAFNPCMLCVFLSRLSHTRTPKIRTMKSAYSPRTMFLYDRFNGMWCTPWHTHSLSCERHTHSDTNTRTPKYGQWSQCIHCDLSLYLVVFNMMQCTPRQTLSHTHTHWCEHNTPGARTMESVYALRPRKVFRLVANCNTLQHTSVLQCVAVCYSVSQCVAVWWPTEVVRLVETSWYKLWR